MTPSQTVPLASAIESAVAAIPGWSPLDQLLALACLVVASTHLEGDVLEIGSWCGRSTTALGLAAQAAGDTRVLALDLFPRRGDWHRNEDGSYSLAVRLGSRTVKAYDQQTVWQEPFERDIAPLYAQHEDIMDLFRAAMRANALEAVVTPVRGTSDELAGLMAGRRRCRLAFVDGDHSYEAVRRDIENVEPHLVDGGWICFDDAFSHYEGVNRAITERIIEHPGYDVGQQLTRKLFVARKKPR